MYQKYINKILSLTLLHTSEIQDICEKAIELFIKEPNFLNVSAPVLVCGDIHGQIYDLVGLFKRTGDPSKTKFIFLGNYVGRGENSTECIFLLLIYKILYPNNIFLIRGNNEQKNVSKTYGLYYEILHKYNINVWRLLCEVFSFFNMGCIINGRILCVHGGITPKTISLDKLRRLDRFTIESKDEYEDILWSDPYEEKGFKESKRGLGYLYGGDVTNTFLECNDLTNIIRSHQFAFEGYKFHFSDKNVITVWSAPDYLKKFGNPGSFINVREDLDLSNLRITVYNHVERNLQTLTDFCNSKF